MKIISIPNFRNTPQGCAWNERVEIGTIDKAEFEKLDNNRKLIKWLRDNGFLSAQSAGKVCVDDDQHSIIVCRKSDNSPMLAIEYGKEY